MHFELLIRSVTVASRSSIFPKDRSESSVQNHLDCARGSMEDQTIEAQIDQFKETRFRASIVKRFPSRW